MTTEPALELIDTHCHLDYDYAPKSDADLVKDAREAGVSTLITIGTEIANLPKVQSISDRFENVYHTVGVHPHEAASFDLARDVESIRKAASHPKCRGIGEIGLDYHYNHSPAEAQKAVLKAQLDLAAELGLPIIVHSRDAEAELLEALSRHAKRLRNGLIPGVIHCFSGTREFGRACVDLGYYISFSGILTFKNAEDLRESARELPLDRILVETDSPYLAPVPYRGKKCEPAMVRATALKLAELRGLTLAEVAAVTTANARRVFKI